MHFSTFAGLAALSSTAFAHYNFESLIVNGEMTDAYQYVRRTKNSNGPILAVNSTDIICNNGGIDDDVMAATETFEVNAGDEVGFKMNEYIGHPGPLAVYLSKAPTTAKGYKGDGEWFKVYQSTLSNRTADPMQWASFVGGGVRNFTFTLPEDLPAGEYLMRGEHIALHSAGLYEAQFYIGCAQLRVTSSGAGTPGPTVQFPGAYDPTDPGILVNMYWPPLRQYTPPGPKPWPNACEDSTVNTLNGQPSDGDCTPLEDSAAGDAPIDEPEAPEAPVESSTAAPVPTAIVPTPSAVAPRPSAVATSVPAPVSPSASSAAAAAPSSTAVVPEPIPSSPTDCRRRRRLAKKALQNKAKRATARK